jgi:hypothetical protein
VQHPLVKPLDFTRLHEESSVEPTQKSVPKPQSKVQSKSGVRTQKTVLAKEKIEVNAADDFCRQIVKGIVTQAVMKVSLKERVRREKRQLC